MDAQTLISLIKFLVPLVLALAAYNTYVVFKLKGVDPFGNWDRNKINGTLLLLFFIIGSGLAAWSTAMYKDLYILIYNPASDLGVPIDSMFWTTAILTTVAAFITNAALFYFAFAYSGSETKKALYYPENNKLEILWTIIPAVVLTILIASGISTWVKATGPSPENAREIELTGKQFEWMIRYPGKDAKFGRITWDSINDASGNTYGYHFSDPNSRDDFNPQEIHLQVGIPVKVNIRARDVLHSATLPHFRMKMDAVPGMNTSFWFTPTITTDSMRLIKGNPKFNYELACQEICGGGHWNMRRVVVIDTKQQYDEWVRSQKPTYLEMAISKKAVAITAAPTESAEGGEAKPADTEKAAPATPTAEAVKTTAPAADTKKTTPVEPKKAVDAKKATPAEAKKAAPADTKKAAETKKPAEPVKTSEKKTK